MGVWNQVAEYLWLKKKDPDTPGTKWVGYMHGINRLSIILFLVAIVVIILKLILGK